MDLSLRHPDAWLNLLFGGVLAIAAIHAVVKRRSVAAMVVWESFSNAFIALGLLDFLELIDLKWIRVFTCGLYGIFLITLCFVGFAVTPSVDYPKVVKWLLVAGGVVGILSAVLSALYWQY